MNTHDNKAVLREAKTIIQKHGWTSNAPWPALSTDTTCHRPTRTRHVLPSGGVNQPRLALIRVEGRMSTKRCATIEGLVLAAIERREFEARRS